MTRVVLVAGTRPEAVKVAPLLLALRADPRFDARLVVTGQHREMLDQVLDAFAVRADVDLDLFSPGQSLAALTGRAVIALDGALADLRPELVVVQGDTTTAFVGALAAFYRGIPVAHLEAGLRTDDVGHPFPEEANRRLITTLAALHLAATPANAARLSGEGLDPRAVTVTGNTVIDALHEVLRRRPPVTTPGLAPLLRGERRIVTVTAHRRESWGRPIADVAAAVVDIAERHDVQVVWPLHRNPTVRDAVEQVVAGHRSVALLEPLPYPDFVQLLGASTLVLSDSGGVQEECPALGVPVLVLRDVTERPEAVAAGGAFLVGTDRGRIVELADALLRRDPAQNRTVSPYGDGRAAERCVGVLAAYLLGAPGPDPFRPGTAAPRRRAHPVTPQVVRSAPTR